jgi:hypothetical protein
MTFIDWSDSEGMFDLLLEFIRDEINSCVGDNARQKFLESLSVNVTAVRRIAPGKAISRLRDIHDSVAEEFKDDPAILHISDFIQELYKVSEQR